MRTQVRLITLLILPIFFFSFIKFENKPTTVVSDYHEYMFTEENCGMFFNCKPEEASIKLNSGGWTTGNFRLAEVDKDGNLVITLSDSDLEYWKSHIDSIIEKRSELDELDGCPFNVKDDYHSIEVRSKKDYLFVDVFNITYISGYCGIMQILNGENPTGWYVDIKIIDVDSGKTVKTGQMPNSFDVSKEDWDKVLVSNDAKGRLVILNRERKHRLL